jgi:hypothetical protein
MDLAEAERKLYSASIKVIICWEEIINYVKYLLSADNIILINNNMFISETKHNHFDLKKFKYNIVQNLYIILLLLSLSFFVLIFKVNCYNFELVSLDNLIITCSIIPVKVFSDLNNIDTIKSYRNELKNKQGVYGIINTINKKQYIGSSKDLYLRLLEHVVGKKSNKALQKSIAKYGLDNFYFCVYKFYEDNETVNNITLTNLETEYIKIFDFNCLYNFKRTATSMLGYKHKE